MATGDAQISIARILAYCCNPGENLDELMQTLHSQTLEPDAMKTVSIKAIEKNGAFGKLMPGDLNNLFQILKGYSLADIKLKVNAA